MGEYINVEYIPHIGLIMKKVIIDLTFKGKRAIYVDYRKVLETDDPKSLDNITMLLSREDDYIQYFTEESYCS